MKTTAVFMDKQDYKLMHEADLGDVILLSGRVTDNGALRGTVIHNGESPNRVGWTSCWYRDDLTPFTGTVTLES